MSDAVRTEVELDAPPEEVWSVVMDPSRLREWVTVHAGLDGPVPEELAEGATSTQRLRVFGAEFDVDWTVVETEPSQRVTWQGSGPGGAKARVRYTLEAAEDGRTRFGYENDYEPPGGKLGRRVGRALGDRKARREAKRTLANLKTLMESPDRREGQRG